MTKLPCSGCTNLFDIDMNPYKGVRNSNPTLTTTLRHIYLNVLWAQNPSWEARSTRMITWTCLLDAWEGSGLSRKHKLRRKIESLKKKCSVCEQHVPTSVFQSIFVSTVMWKFRTYWTSHALIITNKQSELINLWWDETEQENIATCRGVATLLYAPLLTWKKGKEILYSVA